MAVYKVALRKESVDRNHLPRCGTVRDTVALRKESVDRNAYGRINDISRLVALRKESVDRNTALARPSPAANCRSPQGERG